MLILKILIATILTSTFVYAGGNSSAGGGPYKVSEGALKLLIEGNGLKNAMANYLKTVPVERVEDALVRNWLIKMMAHGELQKDLENSNYTVSSDCVDPEDPLVAAGTAIGKRQSEICFNVQKLIKSYQGLSEEDVMINLASLAFHEHTHHFQNVKTDEKQNEEVANRIAGYILVTAKFVQLPLLKWTNPVEGPIEFQSIQILYETIKAKEQAFLAPRSSDYAKYPDYQGKNDRGIIRLLPREKYDGKLSISGGGSYYSFQHLTHQYGWGSDIGLEQSYLRVGFAGCDFGFFVDLGETPLSQVDESHPALKFLTDFKPASGHRGEIRKQQRASMDNKTYSNGYSYPGRTKFRVGQTFGLRSIILDREPDGYDILVAFKIIRTEEDGSLVLAWKKLKNLPPSDCGKAIEE